MNPRMDADGIRRALEESLLKAARRNYPSARLATCSIDPDDCHVTWFDSDGVAIPVTNHEFQSLAQQTAKSVMAKVLADDDA